MNQNIYNEMPNQDISQNVESVNTDNQIYANNQPLKADTLTKKTKFK